jgi:RNA-dependent RNA polymerase
MHSFSPNDFLRVKIGDENGGRMFWNDFTGPVVARIRSSIMQGLQLNGALYQFLAYSSSQLKECSLWMVHLDDKRWTVQEMRRNMGDFSKCTTPSKVAARMGQCFSTTFQGLDANVSPRQVDSGVRHVTVHDVSSQSDALVHSDGNGLIRRSKMISLLKQIPSLRKNEEKNHSIVQIRFGGAKGTIVAWDDVDFDEGLVAGGCATPRQFDVALRDSMVKFDAPFAKLEVCRL